MGVKTIHKEQTPRRTMVRTRKQTESKGPDAGGRVEVQAVERDKTNRQV